MRLWVPFPWVFLQDGRSRQGASREGPGLACVVPGPLPGTLCPALKGDKGTVPWGSDSWPCQPRLQAKSSPKGCPGGQGLVGSLIPFSVTLSLCDLLGHSSSLDTIFREQWRTPGKCPVKQTGFFLTRLLRPLIC